MQRPSATQKFSSKAILITVTLSILTPSTPSYAMAKARERHAHSQALRVSIEDLNSELNSLREELQQATSPSPLQGQTALSDKTLNLIKAELERQKEAINSQVETVRASLRSSLLERAQIIEEGYQTLDLTPPALYRDEIPASKMKRLREIDHELRIKLREVMEMLTNLRERNTVRDQATQRANQYFLDLERNGRNYLDASSTLWIESRCSGLLDSIESHEAFVVGRRAWAQSCLIKRHNRLYEQNMATDSAFQMPDEERIYQQLLAGRSSVRVEGNSTKYDQNRWFYPSFGVLNPQTGALSNPDKIVAPVDGAATCSTSVSVDTNGTRLGNVNQDILEKYTLAAMCVTGCFTPDQQIQYAGGYTTIAQGLSDQILQIVTLQAGSTLDHPSFEISEIESYTADVVETLQEVIDFETKSGKTLTVTHTHAMLDINGQMRPAVTFGAGDFFVAADGTWDEVTSANGRSYFGKVYNIRLKSSDPAKNIIVAQGLLTGTVYFQNEGVKDLNRALFRLQLPNRFDTKSGGNYEN